MIKAIIFDCYGVLYPNACRHFFERHQELFDGDSTSLDKLNEQMDLGKITRADFFTEVEKKTGISAGQIKAEIDQELVVDKRLVEFIKQLKKSYRIGLLSNAGQEEISIIYRDQVAELFDAVTISYEAHVVKPDKEIFLICAKRLGVDPADCLFIDDSLVNIQAAQKLGMETIYYTGFNAFLNEFNTITILQPI